MALNIRLKLGDIVLGFDLERVEDFQLFKRLYHQFLTDDEPEVYLSVHSNGQLPDLSAWEMQFDSGSAWSLWKKGAQRAIRLRSPSLHPAEYEVAIFDDRFTHGDFYLAQVSSGSAAFPLENTLAQVLIVHLLAQGRGILLHAFALEDGGAGRLLAGVSGAGKTTMSGLWSAVPGVNMLSDDRVIVRRKNGRFWIYGTPWCGEGRVASPGSGPLEQVFVLRHASENQADQLDPALAMQQLLVRAFVTFWDAPGMAFSLSFLDDLCRSVPCYDLGFVPKHEVVDFVRSLEPPEMGY